MAQHETSLCSVCSSSCLSTSTGHQSISNDNVQPRRDFVDSLVDSLAISDLPAHPGSHFVSQKAQRSPDIAHSPAPRRIPSNHDTWAPLLAIPVHYVIVVAGVTLGGW